MSLSTTSKSGMATTTSPARLAVVLSHPIQYYSPWFQLLTAKGWSLRVFYLWDFGVRATHDPGFGRSVEWDIDLLSGYEHEFVPNRSSRPGTDHFRGLDNPTLFARLKAWRPDVVLVFGYKYATHLRLLLRSRWPLVFRGDSHLLDHPPVSLTKRLTLRWIYSRFAAVTFVGRANHDYFRTFGVPENRLFFAPHAIDATRFSLTPAVRADAARLRQDLGLNGRNVVLYAGKLVVAKQPGPLLEAFAAVAPANWTLVFVGDGPERQNLMAQAQRHASASVRFLPFANQSEMPSRYALADMFALPSIGLAETWGLAVQEAMHVATPCLVSNRVGCQQDLVTDGITGWVFSADSAIDFRQSLTRAIADCAERRQQFSAAALSRVAGYSYEAAAKGLQAAIAAVLGSPHER